MKYALILVAAIALCQSALAEVYRCDQPSSKSDERIQSGLSYDIKSEADSGVILVINQGAIAGRNASSTEVQMKRSNKIIDGPDVYQAGNFRIIIDNFISNGVGHTSVTLELKQDGKHFEATCK